MGTDQLCSNDVVDDFDGILSGSRFGFESNCFVMLNLFRRIETAGFASCSPRSLTIIIYFQFQLKQQPTLCLTSIIIYVAIFVDL